MIKGKALNMQRQCGFYPKGAKKCKNFASNEYTYCGRQGQIIYLCFQFCKDLVIDIMP